MHFVEKVKCWFSKNKKYILIGGSIALVVVGAGVSYVLCKDKRRIVKQKEPELDDF